MMVDRRHHDHDHDTDNENVKDSLNGLPIPAPSNNRTEKTRRDEDDVFPAAETSEMFNVDVLLLCT